jgi:integrase
MDKALETAAKYRPVSATAAKIFRAFAKAVKVRFMDEVTPEMAFSYLDGKDNGKTFNNSKCALNAIFARTLMDSGLAASPFALIPNRVGSARHQRPFTEDEFRRIYRAAPEPWRTASLIAWFTGLREKDVFCLEWSMIEGDVIRLVPAKTRRFGRGVEIPMHPQLVDALAVLPRKGPRVLGAWPYSPGSGTFATRFSAILKDLGIGCGDGEVLNFNSFRDSFVTRCDEAGIPRHAVRGLVGHVSDAQTDLYSHDLATARRVQRLPRVDL